MNAMTEIQSQKEKEKRVHSDKIVLIIKNILQTIAIFVWLFLIIISFTSLICTGLRPTRSNGFCVVSTKVDHEIDYFKQLVQSLQSQTHTFWRFIHFYDGLTIQQIKLRQQFISDKYQNDRRIVMQKGFNITGKNLYHAINNQCQSDQIVILLNEGQSFYSGQSLDYINQHFKNEQLSYLLAAGVQIQDKIVLPERALLNFKRYNVFNEKTSPQFQKKLYENVLMTVRAFKKSTFINIIPWDLVDPWTDEFYNSTISISMPLLEMKHNKIWNYDRQKHYYNKQQLTKITVKVTSTNATLFISRRKLIEMLDQQAKSILKKITYRPSDYYFYLLSEQNKLPKLWYPTKKPLNFLQQNISKNDELIPKIVHQIWIGTAELSPIQKRIMSRVRQVYFDYEYRFWTSANITKENFPFTYEKIMQFLELDKEYEYSRLSAAGDLMKYEVLYHHGGIYFDINYEPTRNIDNFRHAPLLVNYQNPSIQYVSAGFIASQKQNPILGRLLQKKKVNKINLFDRSNYITGPWYFGTVITVEDIYYNLKLLPGQIVLPFMPYVEDKRYKGSKCVFPVDKILKKYNQNDYFYINNATQVSIIPCLQYSNQSIGLDHFQRGGSWNKKREGYKSEEQLKNDSKYS